MDNAIIAFTPLQAARTLSDAEWWSETQRRRSHKRKRYGRPRLPTPCPICGELVDGWRRSRLHCRKRIEAQRRDPIAQRLVELAVEATALAAQVAISGTNSRAANKLQRKRKAKAVVAKALDS